MSISSAQGDALSSILAVDNGGRVVHDPVQDIPALAAIQPLERSDKMTCLVEDEGKFYRWDAQSAAVDADGPPPVAVDTDGVVIPNDAPVAGRWIAVPNTTALPPVTRDTRDPVSTDDAAAGHQTGGLWLNTVTKRLHACTDNSAGAAVWACVSDPTNPIVSNALDTTPSGVGVNMVGMTYTIPADSAGTYDFLFRAPIGGVSVTGSMGISARLAVNGVPVGETVTQLVDGTGGVECRWLTLDERRSGLAAGAVVTVQWWLGTVNPGNSILNLLRTLRVKKVRN